MRGFVLIVLAFVLQLLVFNFAFSDTHYVLRLLLGIRSGLELGLIMRTSSLRVTFLCWEQGWILQ